MDYLDSVNQKKQAAEAKAQADFLHKQDLANARNSANKIVDAINTDSVKTKNVNVVNDLATKTDINDVITQLKENQLATLMGNQQPSIMLASGVKTEDIIKPLNDKISAALDAITNSNSNEKLAKQLDGSFKDFTKAMASFMVAHQDMMTAIPQEIQDAVSTIDVKPVVNVPKATVNVAPSNVDLTPLLDKLANVEKAIGKIKLPQVDNTDLMLAVDTVRAAIANQKFPVPNYILPFKDVNGRAVQVQLDASGNLPIAGGGGGGSSTSAVDPNNSTTTPLAANGVFTGTGTSALNAAAIEVIMYSNVASAASGVTVQFSMDNTNWDDSATYTFTPGSVGPNQGQAFITSARAEYYRVVYTNGSTLQTTFRLESVLKAQTINGAVIALGTAVSDANHAQLTQSVIVGKTTGGGSDYVPVKVKPSGSLTTADTIADGDDVATGATGDAANTTGTTGTVSGKLRGIVQNQTNGNQQTKITDGTNIVNVLKSDGTAVGQNAQLVAPAYKEVASLTAGALNADLVASTDVSGYSTFTLHILGTFVGTLTLQGSNDNTNFSAVYGTWINNNQPITTATTTGIITGSCNFRYLRVRMTAYTSGTATGVLELKTVPFVPTNVFAQVSGGVTSTPVTARATGNITTSSTSILSVSATGFSWAYITISGTYAGISFGITASDNGGTNYYNVPVWDVQNQKYIAPGATISPTDNSSSSYYVPQSASGSVVRVLSSAYTSGTGVVAITGMSNAPFMVSQAIQSFNSTASAVPTTALPVGFQARSTDVTATTSTYNTIGITDLVGKQIVQPYSINQQFVKGSASATGTTSTSLISAVASNSIYLTSVQVMNTGTVTSQILLQDGSGGSTLAYAQAPAGGGANITFPVPIKNTSGNAWYFAAGSSSTTIYVSAQGYYGV